MSEHVWEVGDWGREHGYNILYIGMQDGLLKFRWPDGSTGRRSSDSPIEYLPDCTGFDWQPIKPTAHVWQWGDWGRTKNGTIVRFVSHWNGDIFRSKCGSINNLCDVEYLPDCTGFNWKPVEPPEGYRLLLPNEQVLVGDKYLPDGDVAHWATICFGENAQRIAKAYARKIETQYRPFRDGDEFEPHADRWVWCKDAKKQRAKVQNYNSESVLFGGNEYFKTYEKAFWEMEFLGGEPFGVENK